MPRYDYRCDEGHVTEAVAGVEVGLLPCPACGRQARRVPFCESVSIQGETVAKVRYREQNPSLRHGYMDMDRFKEAHQDVLRASRKAGVEPPDLFAEARRRVESGEVTKSAVGR